jgi:hypothetical protein
MTIEDIRTECWADPFRPFAVQMNDGRRIPVIGSEHIALGPLGRTIAVCTPDDRFHILEVASIKDLERNADVAVGENGNGMETTDT